jgi:hypothetical protein
MALLDNLERVARNHFEQPYFRFLYVGDHSSRWEALRQAAEATGWFETIKAISQKELRENAIARTRRMEFGVVDLRGCLVEVWDLADQPASGTELTDTLRGLPVEALWSPQTVRFGLAPDGQELRFRDFIAAIEKNFAGVGGFADCIQAIGAWCGAGSIEDPRKLRMSCTKSPAVWLASLKHDYFGNVIGRFPKRPAELSKALISNDFWHDAARNVLRFPFQNSPARSLAVESDAASDVDLIRRIALTPCELIVPTWLEESIEACGWKRGVEYSVYDSGEEVEACLEAASQRGHTRILIQDTALMPGAATADDVPNAEVPRILAGDPEQRRTWQGWTEALSANLLGSFSMSDFVNSQSRNCLPVSKAAYWKPFCFVTLPESMERILSPMLEVYAWLETQTASSVNDALRLDLFRCIAQVWYATGLYFGDSAKQRARMNQGETLT